MKTITHNYNVVILGAGAAGLMCAIEASKRKNRVIVLEHNLRVGKKIRISGGGRCNFTNIHTTPQNYFSANPHFCKSALSGYTPQDFYQLVEQHRIGYHEKKLGQLFCDHSAQDIIDMLLNLCHKNCAEILLSTKILKIEKDTLFLVHTNHGIFQAPNLVVACGGLSIPSLGASSLGYEIAKQFGLNVITPRPALVPLTLPAVELKSLKRLSGVSVPVNACFRKHHFTENLLFTHRGLSGPAILQISSFWENGQPLTINLLPDIDAQDFFKKNRARDISLKGLLSQILPKRFAETFCELYAPNQPLRSYSDKYLKDIASRLNAWNITPSGTEGFMKAEVTAGGVDTHELSSQTMESRKIPGLYFIGEVVDVTGHLGGYNFQWAWASGVASGKAV